MQWWLTYHISFSHINELIYLCLMLIPPHWISDYSCYSQLTCSDEILNDAFQETVEIDVNHSVALKVVKFILTLKTN